MLRLRELVTKSNKMTKVYFFVALVLQASFIYANGIEEIEEKETSREILKEIPAMEEVKGFKDAKQDWTDLFFVPFQDANFHPVSSATLMAAITNNEKSPEEQVEDIKQAADKICAAIQSELTNLLTYAMANFDKEKPKDKEVDDEENILRKKRESPVDSSQLVMRLLKHIKANNEYQNIAIEKMMTAQEIADKFGIEFNPNPEVLSDLAIQANDQAREMTSILQDAIDIKNVTKNETKEHIEFVPVDQCEQNPTENDTYYVYSMHFPEHHEFFAQHPFPSYEYMPEHIHRDQHAMNRGHHEHRHHHEGPMPMPPQQHMPPPPVTPKPNYYDSMMASTPDYFPYCPVEPVTTTTTIILPLDEMVEPEPELIGEEYEETVSSKMIVSRDEEPGTATVNHVMTYTLSEKAHFKKPEIENLPQQMQYSFFLM